MPVWLLRTEELVWKKYLEDKEEKMGTLCLYITIILIIMEQLPLN